jgi:hypothetical protein
MNGQENLNFGDSLMLVEHLAVVDWATDVSLPLRERGETKCFKWRDFISKFILCT